MAEGEQGNSGEGQQMEREQGSQPLTAAHCQEAEKY